jgi:hypothetical protein
MKNLPDGRFFYLYPAGWTRSATLSGICPVTTGFFGHRCTLWTLKTGVF